MQLVQVPVLNCFILGKRLAMKSVGRRFISPVVPLFQCVITLSKLFTSSDESMLLFTLLLICPLN